MIKGKSVLGVVPARAGSKGLPGKNIRPLLGKPLIAWTIEAALKSAYVDKTVVSTEDPRTAEIAKSFGATVPFLRPPELARDETPTIDVLLHMLDHLEKHNERFDYLILLEPTSPLREVSDIDGCMEQIVQHPAAKSIVSVARLEGSHPEFNAVIDPSSGCIRRLDGSSNFRFLRRQELTDVYYFEGTVYVSQVSALRERRSFYHDLTLPYVVPRWKAPEIDELSDFLTIEALLKARLNETL
jgi:CMP-N,N'-diacetyllegionaminic acid synthase